MERSAFINGTLAAIALSGVPPRIRAAGSVTAELSKLEASSGGRLGVVMLQDGVQRISYRANERFPMCSTFKLMLTAAVLARVDRGIEQLDRRIAFGRADLLEYAPVTRAHVGLGFMTVEALCEAAIEYSDNTAANLLLKTIGGPQGWTRYVRTLGDSVSMLNRTEPSLNTGIPGDARDTTTPVAMARNMQKVLLGDALSHAQRARLESWLDACRTGTDLLRAGIPPTWRAGDKSGTGGPNNATGDSDTRNDIAILRPPGTSPIIVTAYLTGSKLAAKQRDAVIAHAGAIVASTRL